jgi:hypothetical protein
VPEGSQLSHFLGGDVALRDGHHLIVWAKIVDSARVH